MNEQEWLDCSRSPVRMLKHLQQSSASERKLRLFACACARRFWQWSPESSRRLIEAAEGYAEGVLTDEPLWQARMASDTQSPNRPSYAKRLAKHAGAGDLFRRTPARADVLGASIDALAAAEHLTTGDSANVPEEAEQRAVQEALAQCVSLRDLFGNPFHPVIFAPVWRTLAVLALAQAAYDNRILPAGHLEPDRLAVLADGLEEAGCTNFDILGHLRGPGPHVRGCWVLDALLEKS